MIIACLSFYNEAPFLSEWLERVPDCVDKVIALDGQIDGFPGQAPFSTDGSLALLAKHAPKVQTLTTTKLYPSEHGKRSCYFVGGLGDWYVVIDADEMLYHGENLREEIDKIDVTGEDFGQIKVVGYGANRLAGRIIRHQPNIQYMVRHYWLGDGQDILYKGDGGPVVMDVWLKHQKDVRSPERLKAKAKFQMKQAQQENNAE